MRIRTISIIAALSAGVPASAVLAQAPVVSGLDAIASRQAIMKNVGASAKIAGQMLKGEVPFDAETADLALRTMNSSAYAYAFYFPEDSKTGGETEAAPAIWEKPAEFQAAVLKFQQDSAAAIAAKPADQAAFQTAFGQVGQNCKSCHESFRVDK